jgi:Domain of unknown function (DUF3854)
MTKNLSSDYSNWSNIATERLKAELNASAIHPDIQRLNFRPVRGQEVYELLLSEAKGNKGAWADQGIVTAPVKRLLDRYECLTEGGWWVSGVDPLNNWEPMAWGQFKGDRPRMDGQTGKPLKYNAPEGTPTRIFAPRLTYLNSAKVANRYEKQTSWLSRTATHIGSILDSNPWAQCQNLGNAHATAAANTEAASGWSRSHHSPEEIRQWIEALYGACREQEFGSACELLQRLRDCTGYYSAQSPFLNSGGNSGSWWLEDLEFYPWVDQQSLPIDFLEGAKKTATIASEGRVAIGLPGVTGAVRKDESSGRKRFYLIPEVEHFATPGREINILFDHDPKYKTRKNVNLEIEKLAKQLKIKGCAPHVVSLPGPEKGVDDFVVAQGSEALDRLYADRRSFTEWLINSYSALTYPASVTVNQRYLDVEIPQDATIVGIKSAKGSGKTTILEKVMERAKDAGLRVLIISHRVQLGQMLGEKLQHPFMTETREMPYDAWLYGYVITADGLVANSQSRFDPTEKWDLVIIDESEQVTSHILTSTTEINSRRLIVLENLKTLFNNVAERKGQILLLDADLGDLSIDFVSNMLESPVDPYIIQNDYKPTEESYTLINYSHPSGDILYRDMVNAIAEGKKPLILTHSQKIRRGGRGGRHSSTALGVSLAKQFPEKRFLVIDSQSIANPESPACGWLVNLAEFNILRQRIGQDPKPNPTDSEWERDRLRYEKLFQSLFAFDAIIATPSIGTGVSIDLRGHFDMVVAFFHGVTSPNECRQFLIRLRDNVPRWAWINKVGVGSPVGDGSGSLRSNLRTQRRIGKAVVRHLKELAIDVDGTLRNNGAMITWSKLAAIADSSRRNYRELVVKGLIEEGQTVQDWIPGANESLGLVTEEAALFKLLLLEENARAYKLEIEAVLDEIDVSTSKGEELKKKRSRTLSEDRQLRRFITKDRYAATDLTEDLLCKDDDGWYPKIRLHYFLVFGREFLEGRDYGNIQTSIYNQSAWMPTLNRSQLSTKVAALELLGIHDLLKEDEIYHDIHPAVQDLATKLRANPGDCRAMLGFSVNPAKDTNMAIVQRVMGLLDLKMQWTGERIYVRDAATGERLMDEDGRPIRKRTYYFSDPNDGRSAVFERWTARNEEKRSESALSTPPKNKSIQGLDTGLEEVAA